jgi:hypothetical protein
VQFKIATHKTEAILDYAHYDVCGPVRTTPYGRHMYFLILIDDFSKKVWVYFMRHKSKTFANLKLWKAKVENQLGERSSASGLIMILSTQMKSLGIYVSSMG